MSVEETFPLLDAIRAQLDKLAAQILPDGDPAFLFRGERIENPDTLTTEDRLYHEQPDICEELERLTAFVMSKALPLGKDNPKLRAAFARHYCLPTQIFDFTSSPRVAINFAANRHWHESQAKTGVMGILDVSRAKDSCACELLDLREFAVAPRAQLQKAFGLIYTAFHEHGFDSLKLPEIADNLGLTWQRFAHLPDDETYLYATKNDIDLMDIPDDPFSGLAQTLVDQFVATHGGFSRKAAQFLSDAVSPVDRRKVDNLILWSA